MNSRNRSILKPLLAGLAVVGLLYVALQFFFTNRIRPHEMTITAMDETAARIGLYFQVNNKLPKELSVLPIRQGYANRITDGNNRPLKYTGTGTNSFTLNTATSGGEADAVHKYTIVNGKIVWPPR